MIFIIGHVAAARYHRASSSLSSPSSSPLIRRRFGLMRKRLFFAPNTVLVAISLATLIAASANAVKSCPLVCACKWKNGKRKVECANRNLTALLDDVDVETQVLDYSKNLLITLDDGVFEKINLLNLQKLYVSDCGLVAIHQRAFNGLTNLVELDLSANALTSTPSISLRHVPAVMRLILAANPIRTVAEAAFVSLKYLTTLDLSDCRIELIEANAFDGLVKLEWLRLDGNRLKNVPDERSLPASVIGGLSLHRNPWICDCNLRIFSRWLASAKRLVAEPVCVEPFQYRDSPVSRLRSQDLACAPYVVPSSLFVEIEQGKNISFVCRVTAVPEARITWQFEDAPIIADNGSYYETMVNAYTASGFDQISELFVFEAKRSNNGTYKCVAENIAGISASNYTLHVVLFDKNLPAESFNESYSHLLVSSSTLTLFVVIIVTIFVVLFCTIIFYAVKNVSSKADKTTTRRRLNTTTTTAAAATTAVQAANKQDDKLAPNVRRYEIVCKRNTKSKECTGVGGGGGGDVSGGRVLSTSDPNPYFIINKTKGKLFDCERLLLVPGGVFDTGGRIKQTNFVDTIYAGDEDDDDDENKSANNAAKKKDCTITTATGTVKLYLPPNSTSASYYNNLYVNPFDGYVAANTIDRNCWTFQLQAATDETTAAAELQQNAPPICVDCRQTDGVDNTINNLQTIRPIENETINLRYNLEGYPYPSKLKLQSRIARSNGDDDETKGICAEKPNKTPILSPPDPFKTINTIESAVKS